MRMIQFQPQPSNLDILWLQVLEQLQPPALQALFQQKAALLTFNGISACIGMPSLPLAQIAQKSLQSVALAFNQVLHQKVHVSIRVMAAPSRTPIKRSQLNDLDEAASAEEVLAAAQSLAAFFDGEVVSPDNWNF